MPNFPMPIDDELKEAIKKTKKGGGVTKETLDTRKRHLGHLDTHFFMPIESKVGIKMVWKLCYDPQEIRLMLPNLISKKA
jgi:hypothetical protein